MRGFPAHEPRVCAQYHRAIELIGRRWTGAIVFLLLKGPGRFAALRRGIPDITDRVLSERLAELEAEGIARRTVVPETPVRVEYSLTKKGNALAGIVDAVGAWAHDWGKASGKKPQNRAAGMRRRA
jgi:DNA-binding HxlR family transcriptional regulator